MKFFDNMEFRGCDTKIGKDSVTLYKFVNLEDKEGEAFKFPCDSSIDLTKFKKGDFVKVTIDYSSKYGSLKVVDLVKGV